MSDLKPLWSSGITFEDLIKSDNVLTDDTIFHLWEDILCLKEYVVTLKEEKKLSEDILQGLLDRITGNVISSSEMKERLKVRKEKLIKGE